MRKLGNEQAHSERLGNILKFIVSLEFPVLFYAEPNAKSKDSTIASSFPSAAG